MDREGGNRQRMRKVRKSESLSISSFSLHFYPTFFLLQVKFTYSVVSVVVPRLEEAILAPVVKKIFKRPSILGQKGRIKGSAILCCLPTHIVIDRAWPQLFPLLVNKNSHLQKEFLKKRG